MSKKKSYNPLKMLGCWIGAGIPFIFFFIYWNFFVCTTTEGLDFGVRGCIFLTSIVGIIAIIIGFLLGYGIHSLIRRLR